MTYFVLNETTQRYQVTGPVGPDDVVAEAKKILWRVLSCPDGLPLTSPDSVRDYLQLQLAHQEREVFAVVFLVAVGLLLLWRLQYYGGIVGGSTEFLRQLRTASHYFDGASPPPIPAAAAAVRWLRSWFKRARRSSRPRSARARRAARSARAVCFSWAGMAEG